MKNLKLIKIHQKFDSEKLNNIPEVISKEFERIQLDRKIKLGMKIGITVGSRGIDNLQTCYGNYCTESNADPQSLLRRIEQLVEELDLNNLNIKISASGCPNSCGIAHLNDIGFYGVMDPEVDIANCTGCQLCVPVCKRKAIEVRDGVAVIDKESCRHCGQCIAVCPFDAIVETRRGFAVLAGGKEGEHARLGQLVSEFLSEEEALKAAEECLKLVKQRQVNTTAIIDQVGLETFKKMLLPT